MCCHLFLVLWCVSGFVALQCSPQSGTRVLNGHSVCGDLVSGPVQLQGLCCLTMRDVGCRRTQKRWCSGPCIVCYERAKVVRFCSLYRRSSACETLNKSSLHGLFPQPAQAFFLGLHRLLHGLGRGCRVYIGLLVSFLPPAFTGFMLSRKTPFFLLLESKQDLGPMDLQTLSPGQENASPPFLFYFVCLLAEFCILIREIWFFLSQQEKTYPDYKKGTFHSS